MVQQCFLQIWPCACPNTPACAFPRPHDPSTNPQTSHKATAASHLWAKARGGEDGLSKKPIPVSDVHSLQDRNTSLCPITLRPVFLRGRTGTQGLDWVYMYSWEVSFPLGQCEDMSVRWQVLIRDSVWGGVRGPGYKDRQSFLSTPFVWRLSPQSLLPVTLCFI